MKSVDAKFAILTGSSNIPLAQQIAKKLGKSLMYPISRFADGEVKVSIPESLNKREIFIIQSTSYDVNLHIMELLLMVDAAKRAGSDKINLLIPYFGYSRQDRKESPRVPISAALVASMLKSAGAFRVLTLDIHSDQQQGFFNGPWDNLYGSYVLMSQIKKLKLKNLIMASPDKGGMIRASAYAKRLNSEGIAIVYKERDTSVNNKSAALDMIGDVKNKNVVLVDDIIDTAGTITNAAKLIKSRGAKRIFIAVTHGLFSANALERINADSIERVFVTDSINHRSDVRNCKKIQIVSLAGLLAKAVSITVDGGSLSDELID